MEVYIKYLMNKLKRFIQYNLINRIELKAPENFLNIKNLIFLSKLVRGDPGTSQKS